MLFLHFIDQIQFQQEWLLLLDKFLFMSKINVIMKLFELSNKCIKIYTYTFDRSVYFFDKFLYRVKITV